MGFSIIGSLIALGMVLPSILFIMWLPPKHKPVAESEGRMIWVILERAGQVGCIVALCTAKTGFRHGGNRFLMAGMIVCICIYYGLWGRYLVKGREYAWLWKPFMGIPIPMAVSPFCVFFIAAFWGKSIWLGVAAVLFAAGHFMNSWRCYRYIKSQSE